MTPRWRDSDWPGDHHAGVAAGALGALCRCLGGSVACAAPRPGGAVWPATGKAPARHWQRRPMRHHYHYHHDASDLTLPPARAGPAGTFKSPPRGGDTDPPFYISLIVPWRPSREAGYSGRCSSPLTGAGLPGKRCSPTAARGAGTAMRTHYISNGPPRTTVGRGAATLPRTAYTTNGEGTRAEPACNHVSSV